MKKFFTILIISFCLLNFVSADISYQEEMERLLGSSNSDEIKVQEEEIQTNEVLNETQILEQEAIAKQKQVKDNQAGLFWFILSLIALSGIIILFVCYRSFTGSGANL